MVLDFVILKYVFDILLLARQHVTGTCAFEEQGLKHKKQHLSGTFPLNC